MLWKIAILLAALSTATAEYGCSDFAQLTHTASGCPANQGNPDCSFIQANAQQFCSTTASSWEIINGPNCNLRGASYGCIFASGLYSTTDQFCCPLIVVGSQANTSATASATATSSSSASASATATSSASATATSSSSASATSSSSASATATATSSARATVSSIATSTATSSSTATGTFTALPSTNITVIYITTTDTSIGNGQAAAIGFSTIFGFVIVCGCCVFIFRRKPAKSDEIVRQITIVEREHRKPGLEIRAVSTV